MDNRSTTRNPILWFIVLVVFLGGGFIYLVVEGVVPGQLVMLSVLSASIVGIVMTGVDQGSAGLRALLGRLLIWRVGSGYWVFALFFIWVMFALGTQFNSLFDGETASGFRISFDIIPMFVAFTLIAGVGQELGWAGFLTTRLQSRFNALTTAVLRAVIDWIWHWPMLYFARVQPPQLADFPYGGWIAQRGFIITSLIMLFLLIIPWSIFFTWVYNNTRGSVLLVAVFHGSEIWVAYWMMKTSIDHALLNNYYGYGLVLLLAVVILVLIEGPQNLSRRYQRIQHQPEGVEGQEPR